MPYPSERLGQDQVLIHGRKWTVKTAVGGPYQLEHKGLGSYSVHLTGPHTFEISSGYGGGSGTFDKNTLHFANGGVYQKANLFGDAQGPTAIMAAIDSDLRDFYAAGGGGICFAASSAVQAHGLQAL